MFSSLFLLSIPHISSGAVSRPLSVSAIVSPCFHHASCFGLVPATLTYGHTSCWFFTALSRLISACLSDTFFHTAPSPRAGSLFLGIFVTIYCHFNFPMPVSSGRGANSALGTITLNVFEHLRNFLDAAMCTFSRCFTSFAFPTHISPEYPTFVAVTFIRIHLLFLVSRCKSLGSRPPYLCVPHPFL